QRSRQTVERWLHDDIARSAETRRHEQAVRAMMVHALTGIGWSQRQIAPVLDVSKATVVSDAHLSIADHLADDDQDVVADAHATLNRISIGADDQTSAATEAARDWLDAQVDAATARHPSPAAPDPGGVDDDEDEDDLDEADQDGGDQGVDDLRGAES